MIEIQVFLTYIYKISNPNFHCPNHIILLFLKVGICVEAIIGGELVGSIEEYNYMVGVLFTKKNDGTWHKTGGVIVSNKTILTGAHSMHVADKVRLVFGTLDLNKPYHEVDVSRDEITIHPKYTGKYPYYNDIAVIRLKHSLNFNKKIGAIDLVPKKFYAQSEAEVIMLGYTKSEAIVRVRKKSNLRSVVSTVANFGSCAYVYWRKSAKAPLVAGKQFCVSLRDGHHNVNEGDSGGWF